MRRGGATMAPSADDADGRVEAGKGFPRAGSRGERPRARLWCLLMLVLGAVVWTRTEATKRLRHAEEGLSAEVIELLAPTVELAAATPTKPRTIVFVGTSFTRAIYFEGMKLVLGQDELSEEDKRIPSYTVEHSGCNLPGKAGVDLDMCGPPGFKVVQNDQFRLIFHFKTYLYTPWADGLMLSKITRELAGQPADLLVLGSAEWGTNKYLKNVTSRDEQAEVFFKETISKIPAKRRLFVYNFGYNRSTKALYDVVARFTEWLIYDMSPLKKEMGQKGIITGHGYAGYGTEKMFEFILGLFDDKNKQDR
jgi:hypothetical protein